MDAFQKPNLDLLWPPEFRRATGDGWSTSINARCVCLAGALGLATLDRWNKLRSAALLARGTIKGASTSLVRIIMNDKKSMEEKHWAVT